MGMDWPKMGFPTPFPAKYGLRIIIRKTYFWQKVGLHAFKIDINNTGKNRPDLPVSAVALPSPYLSSRRGLRPKYFLLCSENHKIRPHALFKRTTAGD